MLTSLLAYCAGMAGIRTTFVNNHFVVIIGDLTHPLCDIIFEIIIIIINPLLNYKLSAIANYAGLYIAIYLPDTS